MVMSVVIVAVVNVPCRSQRNRLGDTQRNSSGVEDIDRDDDFSAAGYAIHPCGDIALRQMFTHRCTYHGGVDHVLLATKWYVPEYFGVTSPVITARSMWRKKPGFFCSTPSRCVSSVSDRRDGVWLDSR